MADRRVVITGVGVVNALGVGKDQYANGLFDGTVGVSRITAFDPDAFPSQVGGESPLFKMNKLVPKAQRKSAKLMCRDIELAVVAADCAVQDAGLNTRANNPDGPIDIAPTRSGVNIGAGSICCDLEEIATAAQNSIENGKFSIKKWGSEGMGHLTPLWMLKYLPNMLSCHLSIIYDLQGPSNSITCTEASGLLAIGEAYHHIAHGRADLMVAGGSESKIHAVGLIRQCLMNRVATKYNDRPTESCRPFDADADGSVVGEGSGIVILEDIEHARKRGATIYAEITGFGASQNFDSDYIAGESNPDAGGITIAIKKALEQADLSAGQIQLLIPHGLAVLNRDHAEAAAIKAAFGDYAAQIPIFASKNRIGNCGAGSAAIDLVTAVIAMNAEKIPANLHCPNQPTEYGLNIQANTIETKINNAVVNCSTYGGQTAAMVISKFEH